MSRVSVCPSCASEDLYYDPKTNELICRKCGLVIERAAPERRVLPLYRGEIPTIELGEVAAGTKIVEKRRAPGEGLRLLLSYTHVYPKVRVDPRTGFTIEAHYPIFNPLTDRMEDRRAIDILYDASIPESVMSKYEFYNPRLAEDKILVLLGLFGAPMPTTAISKVTGLTLSTTRRITSELAGRGWLKTSSGLGGFGPVVTINGGLYREGPLNESYRQLTDRGFERFQEIIRTPRLMAAPEERVITEEPLVSPFEKARPEEYSNLLAGKGGRMYFADRGAGDVTKPREVVPLSNEEADYLIERRWMDFGYLPYKQRERMRREVKEFEEREAARRVEEGKPTVQEKIGRLVTEITVKPPAGPLVVESPSMREFRKRLEDIAEKRRLEGCTHPLIRWSPDGTGICMLCNAPVTREEMKGK